MNTKSTITTTDTEICAIVAETIKTSNAEGENFADNLDSALGEAGVKLHAKQPNGSDAWEVCRLADGRMIRLSDESQTGAARYSIEDAEEEEESEYADGSTFTLSIGDKLPAGAKFVRWMLTNGQEEPGNFIDTVEGYHPDYYFRDGRYLGPDQHGVEPEWIMAEEEALEFTAGIIAKHIGTLGQEALEDIAADKWDEVITDALYAYCGATTQAQMRQARAVARSAALGRIWRAARVEAGEGEDHDIGTIDTMITNTQALVRWDSGITTPAPLANLRRISK